MKKKPEREDRFELQRLLVLAVRPMHGETGTEIEALFFVDDAENDTEQPLVSFEAELPNDSLDFSCNIFSATEELVGRFTPEDLLDACWSRGALEPEADAWTDETTAMRTLCSYEDDDNNL